MSDPRNVAHDKKVIQEKKHHGEDPAKGAAVESVQPGKKPVMEKHEGHEDPATERAEAAEEKLEAEQQNAADEK